MNLTVQVSDESLDKLADLIVSKLQRQASPAVAPQQTYAPQPMQQMVNPYQPAEQQPVYQQPMYVPVSQTPTYQPPPPLGGPPRLEGNKLVFPPTTGQTNQLSGAVDVLTGMPTQPTQAPAAAPVIPQMSAAPVNVGPVAMSAPPNPQLTAQVSAKDIKMMCLRLNNNGPDGQAKLAHVLQQSGVNAMVNVNDQNAGLMFAWLQQVGGVS